MVKQKQPRAAAKQKQQAITAVADERNIDLCVDSNFESPHTSYFYTSRPPLALNTVHSIMPGYKLNEVRRYVLGTIYIWVAIAN